MKVAFCGALNILCVINWEFSFDLIGDITHLNLDKNDGGNDGNESGCWEDVDEAFSDTYSLKVLANSHYIMNNIVNWITWQ